ncbi:MAG TPA: DUF1501 domain-containing protein [Candidatus Sulfopaludibacter sp.]|nr:DUF1501 domain-containing protein [Candidatus Sulfopaludibacter sp.]
MAVRAHLSRRTLLRTTLTAAGLRALPAFASAPAGRALVCIYLSGGNDSNNMLVPLVDYDAYAAARGSLALSRESLIRVTSGLDQGAFGFHGSLPEVADLFQRGAVAVAGSVGRQSGPAAPDPYLDYFPGGYAVPGWVARMAGITEQNRRSLLVDFPNLAGRNSTTSMSLVTPGVASTDALRDAVFRAAANPGKRIGTAFPATGLGQQLRQVAALIAGADTLGMGRQVFLCTLGGFATTQNELAIQAELFRELSTAMSAFYAAMVEIGQAQTVTAYTDTEYSRTLRPNAFGGSDPAWGGHNLVMGGSVLGGNVYGPFPAPTLAAAPHDRNGRGILLPANSKQQYYATLANWFGVSSSQISEYLPGAAASARRTLGFMVTG